MMDMLNKIRQLLGGEKSYKRKSQEDNQISANTKKVRLINNNNSAERSSIDDDYHSIIPSNREGLNLQRITDAPMPRHTFNQYFASPETDRRNRFQLQKAKRPIPGLIKSEHLLPKATAHFRQENTAASAISDRNFLSSIPELYPINRCQQSSFNVNGFGSSHNNNTVTDASVIRQLSGRVASQRHPLSNSIRPFSEVPSMNMTTARVMSSVAASSAQKEEKARYNALLNLIPFYKKSKSKQNEPISYEQPIETVDLSADHDVSKASVISIASNSSSFSNVEPVNTLKLKFESLAIVQNNWETDLNLRHQGISLNNSALAKKEQAKLHAAETLSKECEERFNQKIKSIHLDRDSFIYHYPEEEDEADDFPPLSKQQIERVKQLMYGRHSGQPIITKFSISITPSDIHTLCWEPLAWLNDSVINFYMELVRERSKENEHLLKVHAMNTFFLKSLLEKGYRGVQRWTRKIDIFSYDVIPIPVHKGIHWCMAIIHMRNRTIRYYDSMGAPNDVVLNTLEDYLRQESLDKKRIPFDSTGWVKENMQNIPQQENGSDCGVFSCMFAEFVSRDRPILFTQDNMSYFRMRMVHEICAGKLLA